ncbi:MAG: hypothetical protein OMM_15398, partial [Candidatus Magnetoglobus multicellularis str. Araruama]
SVGGSLVFETVRMNVSLTLAREISFEVTFTLMLPTSSFVGVPVKVRVPALKLSHVGNELSLSRVAVYVNESPKSTSLKVLNANVKLNAESSDALRSAMLFATVGASLVFKIVRMNVSLALARDVSFAITFILILPTSSLVGCLKMFCFPHQNLATLARNYHYQVLRCK